MTSSIRRILTFSLLSSSSWMMYKVAFNLFLRELGFSNLFIGTLTSYEMIGSAILGLVIAVIGDKFGKKLTLILISIGFGFILVLKVSFPVAPFLLFISFLSGSFQTSRMMLMSSYLIDLTEQGTRGKIFGLNAGIMMGSGVFGNLVGGFLGETIGLSLTLLVAACLYIASNFFLFQVPESKKIRGKSLKQIFDFRQFEPLEKSTIKNHLAETFFIAFGAGLFVNFGNVIFKDLFSMSPAMIGTSLSIAQLGACIGSILSYRLSRRFGAFRYASTLLFMVVPLIISLGFVTSPYLFTVLYALRFSFMNMTSPVISTVVLSNFPSDRVTTINSLKNMLNHISRAVAAVSFGLIVALPSGYTLLFLISAVCYAMGFVFLIRTFAPLKKAGKLKALYGNNS